MTAQQNSAAPTSELRRSAMTTDATTEKGMGPSLKTRFHLVIAAVLVVVLGLLVLGKTGLDTVSGVRAYVGGEGLWAKGQKEASYHLKRYVMSGEESAYEEYLGQLAIPLSIKRARLELEKSDPDIAEIRRGFTGGGIHAKDVKIMVWLFKRFRSVEHIERALDVWARGDALIVELQDLGAEIHDRRSAGDASPTSVRSMIGAIDPLHIELDSLEQEFSSTLGEASRWARGLLIRVMLGFTLIGAAVCVVGLLLVTRLTSNLHQYSLSLAEQNRQKSGLTALHERMQGEQNLNELLDNVLTFIAEFVNAQVGAVYVRTGRETMGRLCGYAISEHDRLVSEIRIGEGVVGQAAQDEKSMLLTGVPDDYVVVSSALGEASPRNIFVLPLVFERDVKGVIELGSVQNFTEDDLHFLETTADSIAIFVHGVQSHQRALELLERSQRQEEELQVQQEELRQANEELEEQTEALKDSEVRLRSQQQALEETNSELEERTEALERERNRVAAQNADLESARQAVAEKAKQLALTGRYKSEFLANMSHELRTPLNSILILSKLLADNKEENLTDKQVEFARTVNETGNDLHHLINEVLDLSKIEAGKIEVLIEEVDLEGFTSRLERQFRSTAEDADLEFTVERATDVPSQIRTDEQRLGQIVKNLVNNALKFTHEGGVTLRVHRPTQEEMQHSLLTLETSETVALTVQDTGVGIPEAKRQMIFEAFAQADGATDREYGGTGLGLSISRQLARMLGGEIVLTSEEGKGSRFSLILPEQFQDAETEEAPAPENETTTDTVVDVGVVPCSEESDSGVSGGGSDDNGNRPGVLTVPDDRRELRPGERSVLIIEDDPAFAKVLLDLAHERDYKGLVAEDAQSGLHLADSYLPSVILLDLGLPGMDGLAVISRLKEDLRTRHIPVHVVSGQDQKFDSLKLGAHGFVRKPINMEDLDDAFNRLEDLISRPVKELLFVGGDTAESAGIVDFIEDKDVRISAATSAHDAYQALASESFDCLVIDFDLPDMTGAELLETVRRNGVRSDIPAIVLAGPEVTMEEQLTLDRYADRVISKDRRLQERLLDETSLFLHRVEKDLPEDKRHIIRMLHDKEAIFKNKTLLVVDDDMRNVFALSSILEEKGVKLLVAKDGVEALQRLEERPDVDLVLMDIMMPRMDGYDAMRAIREQGRFEKLPVIALTAKAMKGDRVKCITAGASDYLAKPVDTDKLLSMLRVWLYE